jgi:hypothetical protein
MTRTSVWTRFFASVAASVMVNADVGASCATTAPGDRVFGGGFALYTLTVNNYLAWCSVSENSGPPSSASTITNSFPDYSTVAIRGDPVSATFVWGYWDGTDSGNNDTNQDSAVTMCSDRSVFACCPLPPSTTCP